MSDLSPTAIVRNEDLFVAVSCYFDGGNLHDREAEITLAGIVGSAIQWGSLEERWNATLVKHGAPFVHTTDALALQNEFSEDRGWNKERVHALLDDSVKIILQCLADPSSEFFHGIMPFTITVRMEDFRLALQKVPDLGTPEGVCAVACVGLCLEYGFKYLNANRFNLVFDDNEPFYAHIYDRKHNRKSRKHDAIWSKVTGLSEANMRHVPALQVSDVFAWSTNAKYRYGIHHEWQERLLAKHGEDHVFPYDQLIKPDFDTIERVKSWRLPPKSAFN